MKFKQFKRVTAVLLAVVLMVTVSAAAWGVTANTATVVTLDFENGKGIACKNSGTDPYASYSADPEDPDNMVYHLSQQGEGYGWRGSAMFGATANATTRSDGLVLVGGNTYTVSFKIKIGAGTTWDRVTDGPNAPDYNYRNFIRLSGVTSGFALGGNQMFGKEIKPDNYEGVEDTLQQIYMSEQLPEQWEYAIEDYDWDVTDSDGNYHPYYIITSEEDTPWIDYSTTFTCPEELDGAKLGMTLYVGVGNYDGLSNAWAVNFYMDDVTIEVSNGGNDGNDDVPVSTKTATYIYDFKNYDAYDYKPGTENAHRVLGYGGTTDFTDPETTASLDFWNNSSGPTPYGMIVGGSTDFFKDTGYTDAHGKLDIRGQNGGDPLNFYGGNGVVVKEGYVYEVSVTFVPLNLTEMYKAAKVAIALVQDSETVSARPIGTNYPAKGIYYGHTTLRGRAEWMMTEKSNVYRYSKELQGDYVKDDDFGYPVYENGIYLPEDPDIKWFELCEQTLTATYQYGETDFINGSAVGADLGAHFGILVGSQGASISETQRYLSQICVTNVTIKVTAPEDSTDFNDGDVFKNGGSAGCQHDYDDDNDPICNNCGYVRDLSVTFGDTKVDVVNGKVKVPATSGYFTDSNGKFYFPGETVYTYPGVVFDAAPINVAADNAFSVRTKDYAGLRARGALSANVVEAASEIGFVICPKIAPDLKADWYESSAYTYRQPVNKSAVYGSAQEVNGYQYQVCLWDINDVKSEDFLFAIYAVVDGVTTYTYIGCQSYNSIPGSSGGSSSSNPYASIPNNIKGQTVRFATWENLSSYDFNKFYQDTGIKAEIYLVRQSGYVAMINTKMASGDFPDVIVDNDGGGFPITASILQPINKCSTVDLSDPIWDKGLMETATIDGNVYLVNTVNSPWTGANLIYYNKTIFDRLGEKTPEYYYARGEWTWDTMEDMCGRFAAAGIAPGNFNPKMFIGSAGTSFLKWDYKNSKFVNNVNDPKLTVAYETWSDWSLKGYVGATMYQFETGQAAMYATGSFGLKSDGYFKNMDPDDIGYCYLPAQSKNSTAKVSATYRMYGIARGAKHANAAGYFIRHFLDSSNYNMETTFHSDRAREFYYEIVNTPASDKYFTFDGHCAYMAGLDEYEFYNAIGFNTEPSDVYIKIQSVSTQVDKACTAGNKSISDLQKRYS